MKHPTFAIAALALALAGTLSTARAEETGKPAAPPAGAGHSMEGMSMGGMMMSDERLKQKQEHLLKMHELSNRILSATNPQEKDRLKAEQLQLMKEHEKQHHMMMQQHMQDMMKNKGGMPGMQHGGGAGGMGNMQHGATPPAPPPSAPAMSH